LAGRLTAWRGGRTPRRRHARRHHRTDQEDRHERHPDPLPHQRARPGRRSSSGPGDHPAADLGCYRDADGRERALIARPGADGSVLVIDQDAATLTDRRLVAHLAADEPAANARIAADLYLGEPDGRFARPLEDRDWLSLPDGRDPPEEPEPPSPGELRDGRGRRYRVAAVTDHRYGRQTRWLRRGARGRTETVTLRTVIGALETYEPARAMTRAAFARARRHAERRLRPSAERWRTGAIPTVGATSRIWACFRAWRS
jgi:hypothetical protein